MRETTPDGPRVLVVDDEPSMRALLARVLGTGGYRVKTVGEIAGALAAVESEQFDAIVLDVRLPGATAEAHSGLDILALVRRQSNPPPVVMVTAYALDERSMDQVLTPGTSLFYKPVQFSHLVRHLDEITGRAKATEKERADMSVQPADEDDTQASATT